MSNKKLNIYSYNDYRRFLADYFDFRRLQMKSFSIRYFAHKAGISSHSFISAVIKGKRDLTPACKLKIAAGLGLEGQEQRFFFLLVDFCQQSRADQKQEVFDQLNELRRNTSYYKLNKAHFAYLSKWYYIVIRELAVCASWNGDCGMLASLVYPRISESQAKASIKVLLAAGLLKRDDNGRYFQSEKVLTTSDVPGHLVRQVRKQFIELSSRASDDVDPRFRNLGSATVTLSRANFAKAAVIMDEARQRIVALSQEEDGIHRVYQAHLHLFPLSAELDSPEVA